MEREDVATNERNHSPAVRPCAAAMGILGTPAVRWTTRADLYEQLEHARGFLDHCTFDGTRIRDAAGAAGLSLHHFIRLFHERYGLTPHAYLAARRASDARLMLRSQNLSITEIAVELGFQSASAFGRWFRQTSGTTPTQYRRAAEAKPQDW